MGNQLADAEDEKILCVKEEGASVSSSDEEWNACFLAKREKLRSEFSERLQDLMRLHPGMSQKDATTKIEQGIDTEARQRTNEEMALRERGFCRLFLRSDTKKKTISVGYADLIHHHLAGHRWLERECTLAEFTPEALKDAVRAGAITVRDAGGRVRKFTNFNVGLVLGQLSRLGK